MSEPVKTIVQIGGMFFVGVFVFVVLHIFLLKGQRQSTVSVQAQKDAAQLADKNARDIAEFEQQSRATARDTHAGEILATCVGASVHLHFERVLAEGHDVPFEIMRLRAVEDCVNAIKGVGPTAELTIDLAMHRALTEISK